jgi:hypothetical protein
VKQVVFVRRNTKNIDLACMFGGEVTALLQRASINWLGGSAGSPLEHAGAQAR